MTADHLSGLKHGVTKATRTHEGWSAAGSATVSPATAGPGAGRLLSKAACSHHRRFVRPGGRRGSVLRPVQTAPPGHSRGAVPNRIHGEGAVVELDHVGKRYGRVAALGDVSLAIQPGQVVALLGPNGAGKTTAVSIMLGLRRPTTGRCRLLGLEPTDLLARSRCGAMLQESGVPELLTVREVVRL